MKAEINLENKAKCCRCAEVKILQDFYKTPKGNRLAHCKECHKMGVKNSREKSMRDPIKLERFRSKWRNSYRGRVNQNNQPPPDSDWHEVAAHATYQISRFGAVRRWCKFKNKYRDVKPYTTRDGYLSVSICEAYENKKYRVHRLVAEAFIPNPQTHREVNHIDGDKTNNTASNLEWCTRSHNMKHAHQIGLRNGITKRDTRGKIAKGNRP